MTDTTQTLDLRDADSVCHLLNHAAQYNITSQLRTGSQINLPATGHFIISGDLHDHRLNLRRIVAAAELRKSSDNHVLLQELIHSDKLINGMDMSYRTLVEVAQLQLAFPNQVHVILANHELAQINGESVSKGGVQSVDAFDLALDYVFDNRADDVRQAIRDYVVSMPLALRCENGIMCCHSLPTEILKKKFDTTILNRVPTDFDLTPPIGSGYLLVWGRRIKQDWADQLAQIWDVDLFILGHQPAEFGYELQGDTMLILASDHEHGMILPIDLSREYDRSELTYLVFPLAGIEC